jgi:predicted nucleotidyltransferase
MGANASRPRAVTRWLRRLAPRLREREIEAAYLFGSHARGDADAESDIDLIVVARSDRPFVDRFKDYVDLLDAPGGLDLLVYTPEEFECERRVNRFVRHALREARRIV